MNTLNKTFAAIVVVIVFPIALFAQAEEQIKPCFEVVGTADFDFGTIDQNATVQHTFEFKNTCTDTVHITNAQASCGCTAAIISEKDIPPGGKAEIDVKFHPPGGTRGKVTKTVSVYLKDNPSPVTVLRISAKVATDIEANPNYVQLLGAKVGKEVTGKVTVTNVSEQVVELSEVTANMTAYSDTTGGKQASGANQIAIQMDNVKVSPTNKTLKPNESVEVTISLVPKYVGQISGSITMKTAKGQTFVQIFGVVIAPEPTQPTGQIETKTTDKAHKH